MLEKNDYILDIEKRMKALGVYTENYDPTIHRLADLYIQYEQLREDFDNSGEGAVIAHTNTHGATNTMKNPYITAQTEIMTQILAHERELGITPGAIKKLNEAAVRPKDVSKFASALAALSEEVED